MMDESVPRWEGGLPAQAGGPIVVAKVASIIIHLNIACNLKLTF